MITPAFRSWRTWSPILAFAASCAANRGASLSIPQPSAPRIEHVDRLHGVDVSDPYRWLENTDAPEVRAWIQRERELTTEVLSATPGRATLAARLAKLTHTQTRTLPLRAGEWYYWTWNDGTREQPLLVRGRGTSQHDEVVLDPGSSGAGGWDPGAVLAGLAFSPGGTYLAYAIARGGSELRSWHVLELATLAALPDTLAPALYERPAWTHDEAGFYYGWQAPNADRLRPSAARGALRYHLLGTPLEADLVVLEDPLGTPRSYLPAVSEDGRWLTVSVFEGADPRNRLYFRDLTRAGSPLLRTCDAFDAAYAPVTNEGSEFWVRTTFGAPNGRIVSVDVAAQFNGWTEVLAETEGPLLDAVRCGEWLVVDRPLDLATHVELHPLRPALQRPSEAGGLLPLDPRAGGGSVVLARALTVSARDELFIGYSDTLTPFEHWRFEPHRQTCQPSFVPTTPFDASGFVTEVTHVRAADGALVPARLTRPRAAVRDGSLPLLLYGYGGFNVAARPTHSAAIAAWLELGGAFATAHVRGGGELGQAWHEAGMRAGKSRSVDDFIAVARALVASGWTEAARLAIRGESNGGMLVGAALVRAPEAFGAALPSVGVYDLLRYQRFGLGRAWANEYGAPDDAALFPVLYGYSPYHNVRPGVVYPATLISTSLADERVAPLHSYKFAARLRDGNAGPNPVLLRVDTHAGHDGGTATERQKAQLDEWCFLALALDLDLTALSD